jgi:hypothetical protein
MSARDMWRQVKEAFESEFGGKHRKPSRPPNPWPRCPFCHQRSPQLEACGMCLGCCPRCTKCGECMELCQGHDKEETR